VTLQQVLKDFTWHNYRLDEVECAESDDWAWDLAKVIEEHFLERTMAFGERLTNQIVDGLAANGKLLPDGGTKTQEFGVPDKDVPTKYTVSSFSLEAATAIAARTKQPIMERTVTTWPDGSAYIGPWAAYKATETQ